MILARLMLILGLLFVSLPTHAKQEFIPPMPEDFDQVEVSLITVGYGTGIHTAFGHTIVRVIDKRARTDMVFNWGVFDFSDPWFLFNFAYGRLNYRMAINSISTTLRIYRYQKRTVVQNPIYLTSAQKRQLMEKIIWQAQPENLYYAYHYSYDNCATRVRDYVDLALDGAFKKRFGEADGYPEQLTLRESIQRGFGYFPMVGMALDIVMNSDLEDKMTAWVEMYKPHALQKYLRAMPRIDDNGTALPDSSLLGEDEVMLEYSPPEARPLSGYQILLLILGPFVLVGGLLLWRVPSREKLGIRLFAIGVWWWGLLAGLFSLAMLWYWIVSVHTHGYHNANLWLLWPTNLLWFWYGFKWLWKGERLRVDSKLKKVLYYSCWGHIVCIPLFLLLFISGILKQDVSNPLLYLAPLTLLCSVITLRWGLSKEPAVSNEPSGAS